jgi:hypothetical protein
VSERRPVLITVNGTGEADPFGAGFDADVGRAFAVNPWAGIANNIAGYPPPPLPPVFWQPTGYPAAVFPMNPSVKAGRAEVVRLVNLVHTPGYPLFLSGYSQGAIVTGMTFLMDFLAPNGALHNRLSDLANGGVVNFGDPLRAPGIANGNQTFGFPMPTTLDGVTTGGIAGPLDLHPDETPPWYLSCALDGDLYACAPVGDDPYRHEAGPGKIETRVYDFVESGSVVDFLKIALSIGAPISTIKAIYNGLKFASAGMNAPHWQYQGFVGPAINWILNRI